MFTFAMLVGMEWQQVASQKTANGEYRVDVRWALDRYRIQVWRRVQEPEMFVDQHDAYYLRTAVKTANKMLRKYGAR